MSDCAECGKSLLDYRTTGLYKHPSDDAARLCANCWRRLVWRPRGGPAIKRQRAAERARKETYRGTCVDCGAPTTGSNGPGKAPERCLGCTSRHIAATGERADMRRAKVRADRIAELYEAGAPLKDIAADIGTTAKSIGTEVTTLRKAGRVGYRYKIRNGRKVTA